MYTLTLSECILGVPDSSALLMGPASFAASDSCTSTRIQPNHTKAGLFTAACHSCRHAWTRASAAAAAAGGLAAVGALAAGGSAAAGALAAGGSAAAAAAAAAGLESGVA